jgi:pectate lyase
MYLVSRALPYAFVGACIVACGSGAAPTWDAAPDGAPTPLDAGGPPVDAAMAPADASASDGDAEVDPPSGPGLPFRIEGYGAGTVGGFAPGHDVVKVTSLLDDGPGTLREAIRGAKGPRVVLFEVDGDISLASPLLLPSDLSIDGRGHRVSLRNKGFVIPGTDQIILTHLALVDVGPDTEDGVQIGHPTNGPSEHVVLDHLRFEETGDKGDSKNVDEAISVVFGSRFITIAYCRFVRWEKVMLFGNGDAPAAVDAQIRVTVHHNWARETGRRHPQARYGVYDFYDNFWDDWRMFGFAFEKPYREAFGAQAQDGAQILFENNLVRRDAHPYDAFSQANDATRCESGGVIDERGTWVTPDSTAPLAHRVGCGTPAAPLTRPYPARVEPADAALRRALEATTGDGP